MNIKTKAIGGHGRPELHALLLWFLWEGIWKLFRPHGGMTRHWRNDKQKKNHKAWTPPRAQIANYFNSYKTRKYACDCHPFLAEFPTFVTKVNIQITMELTLNFIPLRHISLPGHTQLRTSLNFSSEQSFSPLTKKYTGVVTRQYTNANIINHRPTKHISLHRMPSLWQTCDFEGDSEGLEDLSREMSNMERHLSCRRGSAEKLNYVLNALVWAWAQNIYGNICKFQSHISENWARHSHISVLIQFLHTTLRS